MFHPLTIFSADKNWSIAFPDRCGELANKNAMNCHQHSSRQPLFAIFASFWKSRENLVNKANGGCAWLVYNLKDCCCHRKISVLHTELHPRYRSTTIPWPDSISTVVFNQLMQTVTQIQFRQPVKMLIIV